MELWFVFYNFINAHSNVINVILAFIAVVCTLCIHYRSTKNAENSQKNVEVLLHGLKNETLDFHKRLNNDGVEFLNQMVFEQNRPYLVINPYNMGFDVRHRGVFAKSNNIIIGFDYDTDKSIDEIYHTNGLIDNPRYRLELSNHGNYRALSISIQYNVLFKNGVLNKISDKIRLINEDSHSKQDIEFFGERDLDDYFSEYRVESNSYSNSLNLSGQIDDIDEITNNESVYFNIPKDLFILQQVLLAVDLARDQNISLNAESNKDIYTSTHLSDDVSILFDVRYSDALGNHYHDTFELSTLYSYRGYGFESSFTDSNGWLEQTIYPKKTKQLYTINSIQKDGD